MPESLRDLIWVMRFRLGMWRVSSKGFKETGAFFLQIIKKEGKKLNAFQGAYVRKKVEKWKVGRHCTPEARKVDVKLKRLGY